MKTTNECSIGRLPPHSEEAEQGVLGCILLDPPTTLSEVLTKLRAGPGAFYDLRHQIIFQAMLDLWTERVPVDLISLQQRLKDQHKLGDSGGLAYLSSLADVVPSAANVCYYLDVLRE